MTPTNPKYFYYMDFVKIVANISYNTLDELKQYENDSMLQNVNMIELVAKV